MATRMNLIDYAARTTASFSLAAMALIHRQWAGLLPLILAATSLGVELWLIGWLFSRLEPDLRRPVSLPETPPTFNLRLHPPQDEEAAVSPGHILMSPPSSPGGRPSTPASVGIPREKMEDLHSHRKLAWLSFGGRFARLLQHYTPSYKFFFGQPAGWASFALAILSCNQYFFAHFSHPPLMQDPHGTVRTVIAVTALEIPLGTWVGPWLVDNLGARLNGMLGCSLHAVNMGLAVYLPPVRTRLSLKPKDALLWLRSGLGVSRAGLLLFDLAVRDINRRVSALPYLPPACLVTVCWLTFCPSYPNFAGRLGIADQGQRLCFIYDGRDCHS